MTVAVNPLYTPPSPVETLLLDISAFYFSASEPFQRGRSNKQHGSKTGNKPLRRHQQLTEREERTVTATIHVLSSSKFNGSGRQ